MIRHRRGGVSYLSWRALSINEGQFPNVYVRWWKPFGFYIAISRRIKWWWWSNAS